MPQEAKKPKRWLMWLFTLTLSLVAVSVTGRLLGGSWPSTNTGVAWVVGLALISAMYTMWNHDRRKKG